MNSEKLKKDFSVFQEKPELTYLDNAATTQTPERVIERVNRFYREENANIGRSLHELGYRATEAYENSRKKVADFIGGRKDEIVFTRNATESINLVASSLELDGKILVPETAHHSEQLPWRRKAEEEGLEFEFIPADENGIDLEAAEKMFDEDTALVSVSHVSNVYGNDNPVEELAELAHKNDAYIMVDGAQSVPRIPTDVKELDVDFLVFSGHKMLGPTGIGVLYARKELLEEMEPYQTGGGMIRTVKRDETQWEESPQKFEAGTPNIAGTVGLAEAIEYLENVGLENIQEHEKELAEQMIQGLAKIDGVKVLSPESACLVSFTMKEAHPHDISEILNQEDVAIRAGHHCAQPLMEKLGVSATARASPYLYNTEEDVEKFLEAIRKVREVFR